MVRVYMRPFHISKRRAEWASQLGRYSRSKQAIMYTTSMEHTRQAIINQASIIISMLDTEQALEHRHWEYNEEACFLLAKRYAHAMADALLDYLDSMEKGRYSVTSDSLHTPSSIAVMLGMVPAVRSDDSENAEQTE